MKKLHLLCGLPRSGKTTYAKTLDFPIVNPDNIRLAIHGLPFLPEKEGEVWKTAETMVKTLFMQYDDVIFDATNVSHERRKKWLSDKWETVYYCFMTPLEVCIERAKKTNQEYLIPVIERMNKDLKWPTVENNQEIHIITYMELI